QLPLETLDLLPKLPLNPRLFRRRLEHLKGRAEGRLINNSRAHNPLYATEHEPLAEVVEKFPLMVGQELCVLGK
ncbi:hypothetical protein PSY47_23810, partial [Shigella flexneri]|nr:hypothetical protein [Shigella flexneri]